MQAIVMAGGEGSRLRPITSTRPKPLVPVVNRPIIWHVLKLLKKHSFTESFITLHYLADQVITLLGEQQSILGLPINYSFEDKPLGTAGSVKALEGSLDGTFIVISGDVITDFDLSELVAFHKKKGAAVTIGLAKVENPLEYGVVLSDEEGRVTKFLEKPGWSDVFSETVNSGIYIIEKEVLKHIEPEKQYDFSKELFPRLLKKGTPIYAHALEGYWCDVGVPSQYISAHYDILGGKTKLEIPGRQVSESVWVEDGVLPEGVEIRGPVLIGKQTNIARGAKIGSFSCIGSNVTIESEAVASRAIIFDFAYLGRGSEAKGCIVGKGSVLRPRARAFEGAVVGDGSQLGSGSEVMQNVKIWPDKSIESGASVRVNLVWGLSWQRKIFGSRGITGLSNIEITPETTAKMGAAFGTFVGSRGRMVAARDNLRTSRMLKRSFMAGLLSTGSTIFNLESIPIPISRLAVRSSKLDGGVYFSASPSEPEYSLIQFMDEGGYNISAEAQRKVENILFKEEIHRAAFEELSDIFTIPQTNEDYQSLFLKNVDSKTILNSKPRVVVDCAFGPLSTNAPQLLSRIGCEVVSLNAGSGNYPSGPPPVAGTSNLKDIVSAVGAIAGFRFLGPGDTLRITDETGSILNGDESLALMTEVMSKLSPGTIAVPVSSSGIVETLAEKNGQNVKRIRTEPRALMESVGNEGASFAGNDAGEFVLTKDIPFPDGLLACAKLVEYLSKSGERLSRLRKEVYQPRLARGSVIVPWNERGRIMRRLASDYPENRVETLEGIKLLLNGGWVLINPSSDEPIFEIVAESTNASTATEILREFQNKVSEIVNTSDSM